MRKHLDTKEDMFVFDKLFWTTKNKIPVRFIFEIGWHVYEVYDLYGNYPKYKFGFCLAIVYKRTKEYGRYDFIRDYFGIII